MPENPGTDDLFESGLKLENRPELDTPKMYRVLMHNDHYTTMDFVVEALMKIFHKPSIEANKLMMDVHKKGVGICGVFTYDIALTKISQVHQMAKQSGFPLKCSYEEA
jgi:ATP-dependent Clp protease adaptor protein ClpS